MSVIDIDRLTQYLSANRDQRIGSAAGGINPVRASHSANRYDFGMSLNAHPMIVLLLGAVRSDPAPTRDRVVQAAVHAWMEGHLSAPGHPRMSSTDAEFPSPPFPDPHDDRLHAIVDETMERFDPIQIVPAVAYASSLAWIAGETDGADCGGCALPNGDTDVARAVRGGEVAIRFIHPDLDPMLE